MLFVGFFTLIFCGQKIDTDPKTSALDQQDNIQVFKAKLPSEKSFLHLGYCFNPSWQPPIHPNPKFVSFQALWGLALCGFGWWSNASKNVAGGVRGLGKWFQFWWRFGVEFRVETDGVFGQRIIIHGFFCVFISRKWLKRQRIVVTHAQEQNI